MNRAAEQQNLIIVGVDTPQKEAAARALAQADGRTFLSIGEMMTRKTRMPAEAIEEAYGRKFLHACQREAVAEAVQESHAVIDCTSDLLLQSSCREALQKSGILIWVDTLPLVLQQQSEEEQKQSRQAFRELNASYWKYADWTVKVDKADQDPAAEILAWLKRNSVSL